MSTGDLINFTDESGKVERIVGTLNDPGATTGHVLTVQADKSIAAAAGGGGGATAQAVYTGNNVSVNDGASANLTFDTLSTGTALLDISVPDTPTFIDAGTYAVAVLFVGDPLTAAGNAVCQVGTGALGGFDGGQTTLPAEAWGASGTVGVSAGDSLFAEITNNDGAIARNFQIAIAVVVKIA